MTSIPAPAAVCLDCRTQLGPGLLECPACRRLVHATVLSALARQAAEADAADDVAQALTLWRQALDLLPAGSRQHAVIVQKISHLSARKSIVPPQPRPSDASHSTTGAKSKASGCAAAAAAVALLLWKFKFLLVFMLTKGKLLLVGLTKSSTFLSMFLSFAVYWTVLGWPFALGLVISIYIHEMGHVEALRRYGFAATAPMFIPGLGALIRLRQHPANPIEDARIGLAGPLWGLGAAAICCILWLATKNPLFAALTHIGALLNLFNLIPIWQLDGARGFRALSRKQAWLVVAALGAAWFFTADGLIFLVALVACVAAAAKNSDDKPDTTTLIQFVILIAALGALSMVKAPIGSR
jgi:Zn-dependent protease